MTKVLAKAKKKNLFGVCQGISNFTDIDVSLVRLSFIIGTIFTGSILLWVYLLLAIVLPNED